MLLVGTYIHMQVENIKNSSGKVKHHMQNRFPLRNKRMRTQELQLFQLCFIYFFNLIQYHIYSTYSYRN